MKGFNGCDSLFRKGETELLSIIGKDLTGLYVNLFTNIDELNSDVNWYVVPEFVCRIYAVNKTNDVNEASYQKLFNMTGKVNLQVITISLDSLKANSTS